MIEISICPGFTVKEDRFLIYSNRKTLNHQSDRKRLSAAVQLRDDEIVVAQAFSTGQAAVNGMGHHLHSPVSGAIQIVFET